MIHRNRPPTRKPTTAGNHDGSGPPSDISIAGASSDQKLAAIMMPAAKPSMAFSTRLLTVLKKNTPAAPRAVIAHVKHVARSAARTGPRPDDLFDAHVLLLLWMVWMIG